MTAFPKPRTIRHAVLSGVLLLTSFASMFATATRGTVTFGGLPVPGATVTAVQGTQKLAVVTGPGGEYTFADLRDGTWTISVEMLCFEPEKREVAVAAGMTDDKWELKMLSLAEILATAEKQKVEVAAAPAPALSPRTEVKSAEAPKPEEQESARAAAADGFLINGTQSNAATSQYSLTPAFGNTRSSKSFYTGGLGVIFDNSATDAAPYSFTGQNLGKPTYNRVTEVFTFGGPLNIPKLMPHGPNLFWAYRRTRDRSDITLPGLVPTVAERAGNLAGDPGAPAVVAVNAQAANLLALYPLPNVAGNGPYNYQVSTRSDTHSDLVLARLDKQVSPKNQVYGGFQVTSDRSSATSLFGFNDSTDTFAVGVNANWQHRFNQRLYQNVAYNFSRLRTLITPQFAGRVNVSGAAGITPAPAAGGNLQDPRDWGPPTLVFSNGISSLTDNISTFDRNRTDYESYSLQFNRPHHNVTVGGDFRRQQFNVLAQADPRGTYSFTGAATAMRWRIFLRAYRTRRRLRLVTRTSICGRRCMTFL